MLVDRREVQRRRVLGLPPPSSSDRPSPGPGASPNPSPNPGAGPDASPSPGADRRYSTIRPQLLVQARTIHPLSVYHPTHPQTYPLLPFLVAALDLALVLLRRRNNGWLRSQSKG